MHRSWAKFALTLSIAAALWVAVYASARDAWHFFVNSRSTTGKVLSSRSESSCKNKKDSDGNLYESCSTVYFPTIDFADDAGHSRVFASTLGVSQRPSDGSRVGVRYLVSNPAEARLDSWASYGLVPTVLGAFAALASVLSFAFFPRRRPP